jgi:uncharacterized protein (TIGR01777 family)
MKTIGITGGTGFVGRHLAMLLVSEGYKVVIFTRSVAAESAEPNITYAHWDSEKGECDNNAIRSLDAIVHLAGASLADKRWTDDRKKKIVDSRVKVTDFLVSKLEQHGQNCKIFVSASAMGYYGEDTAGRPFTEDAAPARDFLAETCKKWEAASNKAAEFARTVILRFGIVLGNEAGAFPKFVGPLKLGVMPILGSGEQVMSWIEVSDLARLILFAIQNERISGVFNAVSPNPVKHRKLMKTIARIKGGIAIPAPVPSFLLKVILGEMSSEVLKSCTVSAEKTLKAGFEFKYPTIEKAVTAILKG